MHTKPRTLSGVQAYTDRAWEPENAARMSWPATEPPVDGSSRSRSNWRRAMASQRPREAEPGGGGEMH